MKNRNKNLLYENYVRFFGQSPGGKKMMLGEAKWIRPSDEELEREYRVEYEKKGLSSLGLFDSFEDFKKKADSAKLVTVTPALDSKIGYRSNTSDMDSLLSLIRSYKSYPKYRNEKTIEDLYNRIKSGDTVYAPIVFKFPDGRYRVFSGNTRMDIAFQLGKNPEVLMIEV